MKLKVYKPEEYSDKIYLKMEERSNGVAVIACNEKGERVPASTLITFDNEGFIILHPEVNKSLGFMLDERGHIKTVEK